MKEKTEFELIDDKIIICKLQGVYSTNAAIHLYKALRKLIQQQPDDFAIIMDLIAFEGSTPEGYEEAEQFNSWLLDQNIITKVNVRAPGITQKIVETRIPTREKLHTKEFSTRDEAIAYVRDKLTL